MLRWYEEQGADMSIITANDLKTRGVGAIEESLASETEALVSVRGTLATW